MHRSYNSYNPVASKLLQKRWDEKHFDDHRKAVNHVRPEIDSTPPVTFMHLHLKLKKLQLEEERLATIERDNRILLEKMSHTMRNKGQLDNINSAVPKSLSKGRRERELLRITRENMNMLKRIAYKKPAISRAKHEEDWKENLHFMSNISSFPEDWYLRNRNHAHSQPALNSYRSDETKQTSETYSTKKTNETVSTKKSEELKPVLKKSKTPEPIRKAPTPSEEEFEEEVESRQATPVRSRQASPVKSRQTSPVKSRQQSAIQSRQQSAAPSSQQSAAPSRQQSAVPSRQQSAAASDTDNKKDDYEEDFD